MREHDESVETSRAGWRETNDRSASENADIIDAFGAGKVRDGAWLCVGHSSCWREQVVGQDLAEQRVTLGCSARFRALLGPLRHKKRLRNRLKCGAVGHHLGNDAKVLVDGVALADSLQLVDEPR